MIMIYVQHTKRPQHQTLLRCYDVFSTPDIEAVAECVVVVREQYKKKVLRILVSLK